MARSISSVTLAKDVAQNSILSAHRPFKSGPSGIRTKALGAAAPSLATLAATLLFPQTPQWSLGNLVEKHIDGGYFAVAGDEEIGSGILGRPAWRAGHPTDPPRGKEIEVQGRTMVTVNESTAHVTGLLAGLGVGQTFRYIAQTHFKTGALIPVLKNWGRPSHPIHVMYPPNRHLNAKVRVFVDWAVEVFAKFDARVANSGRQV
jgi:DNA-binding transcriptional LysR family regulator